MGENTVVAETGRRLWAFLTDEALRGLFFLPVVFTKTPLALMLCCWLLYWAFRGLNLYLFETSPGKAIAGLKVRSVAGPEIGMAAALIRPLADDLGIFFGLIPRLWALIRFDRRHLSDLLAQTQVVQFKNRGQFPRRRWLLFWGLFLVSLPSVFTEALELISQFSF